LRILDGGKKRRRLESDSPSCSPRSSVKNLNRQSLVSKDDTVDSSVSLDERLNEALSVMTPIKRNMSDSEEVYVNHLNGDDSVGDDEDLVSESEAGPDYEEEISISESEVKIEDNLRKRKEITTMTKGEKLTRDIISFELSKNGIGKIDTWDPLVPALSGESRKQLIKEIDSAEDIIPLPGALTPPLRRKGSDAYGSDLPLFQMMNEVESVVRGSSQCMALSLDGKGQQAVKKLGKLILLGSNVLSRLNAERLKLHLPRQLAMKALRKPEEPVLREAQKKVLREAAQESRDMNTVSRSFFLTGGRGKKRTLSRNFGRQPSRAGGGSFPRTAFTQRTQQSGWKRTPGRLQGSNKQFRTQNNKTSQQ
jgi:hypothetical protein